MRIRTVKPEWMDERCMSLCESPIEQMFLAALLRRPDFRVGDVPAEAWSLAVGVHPIATFIDRGVLYAQLAVCRFRLDFAIIDMARHEAPGIAIELDGHDFHERTKEQAARDRSRDRRLTSYGFRVVRFTGSEVHRDADGCAAQLVDLARSVGWDEVLP